MLLLQVLDGRQTVAEVLGGGHGPLLVDPGHLVTHVPVELEQEVRLLQVVTADLTWLGQRLVPGREEWHYLKSVLRNGDRVLNFTDKNQEKRHLC